MAKLQTAGPVGVQLEFGELGGGGGGGGLTRVRRGRGGR